MVVVKVLRAFDDRVCKCPRRPGDTFDATEERAAYIAAVLPGYIEVIEQAQDTEPEPQGDPGVDLTKLTNQALKDLCVERGIAVPARAKKADLLALLTKE